MSDEYPTEWLDMSFDEDQQQPSTHQATISEPAHVGTPVPMKKRKQFSTQGAYKPPGNIESNSEEDLKTILLKILNNQQKMEERICNLEKLIKENVSKCNFYLVLLNTLILNYF